MQILRSPSLLFDYDALCDVWAREIIPAQVLLRRGLAAFFSPARLDTFGLP
jgi:hypothetical protein